MLLFLSVLTFQIVLCKRGIEIEFRCPDIAIETTVEEETTVYQQNRILSKWSFCFRELQQIFQITFQKFRFKNHSKVRKIFVLGKMIAYTLRVDVVEGKVNIDQKINELNTSRIGKEIFFLRQVY